MMDQFRWYYNATNAIFYDRYGGNKNILKKDEYSYYTVRELVRKYSYEEKEVGDFLVQEFVHDENRNEVPVPEWWDGQVHSRLPRGAIKKYVGGINSVITNYKAGNIKHFDMKFMRRKDKTEFFSFEDYHYPSFLKKIKSRYWYTTREHKRKNVSLSELGTKKRGLEIIHDKVSGKYFLHYPVDRDWFPEDDRRNDKQGALFASGDRIISLDPGVRKFLVGYDPKGNSIFIGEGAQVRLISLLLEIDKTQGCNFSDGKK